MCPQCGHTKGISRAFLWVSRLTCERQLELPSTMPPAHSDTGVGQQAIWQTVVSKTGYLSRRELMGCWDTGALLPLFRTPPNSIWFRNKQNRHRGKTKQYHDIWTLFTWKYICFGFGGQNDPRTTRGLGVVYLLLHAVSYFPSGVQPSVCFSMITVHILKWAHIFDNLPFCYLPLVHAR